VFEITRVLAGQQTLVISFVGLEKKEISVMVVANQTTTVPDIALKEDLATLSTLIVEAHLYDLRS
jgi:hypothetical protein